MRDSGDISPDRRVVVTGMGVVSAIGQDLGSFASALREGRSEIRRLTQDEPLPGAPAAMLDGFHFEDALSKRAHHMEETRLQRARRAARRAPLSVQASVVAALDAWHAAGLDRAGVPPESLGIIVAGHNLSAGYTAAMRTRYAQRPTNISPRYALHFFDTDHVGTLSDVFELRGEGMLVGGASASGNVGILQGWRRIRAGEGPCLVVGALMELSELELCALYAAGALVGPDVTGDPRHCCRPFDEARQGFVYGQASACLVLESLASARQREVPIWGEIAGAALVLDGNQNPDPSVDGQVRAMRQALHRAGAEAEQVGYVNAHATASRLGDEVELEALATAFSPHHPAIWLNSTKALTGHGLTSAGVVEAIATLIQMNQGFIHPNPNLNAPLRRDFRFAGKAPEPASIDLALSNSFAFGGISTSVVLARSRYDASRN